MSDKARTVWVVESKHLSGGFWRGWYACSVFTGRDRAWREMKNLRENWDPKEFKFRTIRYCPEART